MSSYIDTETNAYPLFEGDIKLLCPEVEGIPERFAEVLESPFPVISETQVFEETDPVINELGKYERVYIVRELTQEELQSKKAISDSFTSPRIPEGPYISAPEPDTVN